MATRYRVLHSFNQPVGVDQRPHFFGPGNPEDLELLDQGLLDQLVELKHIEPWNVSAPNSGQGSAAGSTVQASLAGAPTGPETAPGTGASRDPQAAASLSSSTIAGAPEGEPNPLDGMQPPPPVIPVTDPASEPESTPPAKRRGGSVPQ